MDKDQDLREEAQGEVLPETDRQDSAGEKADNEPKRPHKKIEKKTLIE